MTFKRKTNDAANRQRPKFILRNKRGHYTFLQEEPSDVTHNYAWVMACPRLVTLDELKEELVRPGRCWFVTDKFLHSLAHQVGAVIGKNRQKKKTKAEGGDEKDDGTARVESDDDDDDSGSSQLEPYVCLRAMEEFHKEQAEEVRRRCPAGETPEGGVSSTDVVFYWIGPRMTRKAPKRQRLILSVAEMYLKSALHQKRMMQQLLFGVRRVLHNDDVGNCGNALIEVRDKTPSEDEIAQLRLLPGLGKVYGVIADEKLPPGVVPHSGGYDPRGEVICDGAGGMPIQAENRVVCLMSGGIDSPVAAYKMMVRGCHVDLVHYLNSTSEIAAVMDKNRKIAQRLSQIQGSLTLRFVDIQKIQAQIVAKVPNQNRTLVYKWFMLALSSALAGEHNAKLLVVGDSVGQVASQTVDNISSLYRAVDTPVIAPLVGTNKIEIVDCARQIGTLDFSTIQASDCCQYMMCKTGANLFIGPKTLRGCAKAILNDVSRVMLPVKVEFYYNGNLVRTEEEELKPVAQAFISGGSVRAAVAARNNNHLKCGGGVEGSSAAVSVGGAAVAQSVHHSPQKDDDSDDEEDPAKNVANFDCAAGTVVHHKVHDAMLRAPHGNPSTLHASGRAARMAIEQVRAEIALMLGVPAVDIIFTSGGTESNRIAIHGNRVVGRSPWMHASTADDKETDADDGRPTIAVVDVVNHETGSINAITERPAGVQRLHVDACQAFLKIDLKQFIDMRVVDSMALTAHKINGPIGCGVLYVRNLTQCLEKGLVKPLFFGGIQEAKLRPGTENTPAIIGLGAALKLNRSNSEHEQIDALVTNALADMGCTVNRRGKCSGFICHATIPEGLHNVDVVSHLSAVYNVEIGTGSACKTNAETTQASSGVYETLGIAPIPLKRSIRLSWDHFTTMGEAERALHALAATLKKLKK